jgi:high affinity choline transporter 7
MANSTNPKSLPTSLIITSFIVVLVVLGYVLEHFTNASLYWPGYMAMILFYAIIFWLGVHVSARHSSDPLLANHSLPLGIAIFTMSATWVGGGFINGTAEYIYSNGLIWVQAPWGYALSLIVGGLIFARPMRRRGYTTLLDPIAERFGKKTSWIFYIPALTGDLFWSAAILTALGTTFGTILGLDSGPAILISAGVVITYTWFGGLWSVSITDIFQFTVLLIGLAVIVPFALQYSGGLLDSWSTYRDTFGRAAWPWPDRSVLGNATMQWWDFAFMLVLGGIPWQVYFQRVLAAKNERVAVRLSILAGFFCLLAAIPAMLIGMAALTTPWQELGLSPPPDPASALPHVIRYLTPPVIATLGLGAVAAAVMSSADSSILSASSLTAWNIIRPLRKRKMTQIEITKYTRRSILVIGAAATFLALQAKSIYVLWVLCSDLVYCLLFPALVVSLFDRKATTFSVVVGFSISFIMRMGCGEPGLGIPNLWPLPEYDGTILVPFRTICMVTSLVIMVTLPRMGPFLKNRSLQNENIDSSN